VQRHLAGLGELAGPDGHHAGAGIGVAAVQAAGLADAHPGHGQQCDERGVVQRPQRVRERGRRLDQGVDLLGREQVGGDAPVAVGHQLGGRDLGRRVQRAQMPGEDAYHRQPVIPVGRVHVGPGLGGPGDGEVGGDVAGACLFEVLDEVHQPAALAHQAEPEGPAHRQIVADGLA
jgi:hypothetical protein